METSELFRITLKSVLDEMPRGAQSSLADDLGVDRRYINDFLNGRRSFSESVREKIAEKLGYSYIDFLVMGREMLTERNSNVDSEKQNKSKPKGMTDKNRFLELVFVMCYSFINNMLDYIGKSGFSIRLSSEVQARMLIYYYEDMKMFFTGDFIDINEYDLIDAIELIEYEWTERCDEIAYNEDVPSWKLKTWLIFEAYTDENFFQKIMPDNINSFKDYHDNYMGNLDKNDKIINLAERLKNNGIQKVNEMFDMKKAA